MKKQFIFDFLFIILCHQILSQIDEQIKEDAQKCRDNEDINTCTNVKLKSGIYQCCKATYTSYSNYYYSSSSSNTLNLCLVQIDTIKTFNEEMERKSTKALYKEIWGYVVYSVVKPDVDSKIEMIYNCKDGTWAFRFGFDTYTDEEIEILQSENHCMSYFYGLNEFTSKEECFNSEILPSSKKAGLSCGYFEFNIKYSDGTSQTIKSCNIFNKDIITNNHLDDKSKENFESFVNTNKNNEKTVVSFVVALSDDKENSVVYDSLTQSIKTNNSEKMICLIKYLLYLFLLIIL